MNLGDQIERKLSALLGLPLTITSDVADMKVFQFGKIRPHPSSKGTVGDFALHVQCPWRLVTSAGVVTGSGDYYQPAVEREEVRLDDHRGGNLERKRLLEILGGYDDSTRSLIKTNAALIVTGVHADAFGGLDLELSGGFRLQVFPSSTLGEDWRFFSPGNDDPHFVIEGGRQGFGPSPQP